MHNVVSTGTNLAHNMAFYVPIGCASQSWKETDFLTCAGKFRFCSIVKKTALKSSLCCRLEAMVELEQMQQEL